MQKIEKGNWRKPSLWSQIRFNLRMRIADIKEAKRIEANMRALKECSRPTRPLAGLYHYGK